MKRICDGVCTVVLIETSSSLRTYMYIQGHRGQKFVYLLSAQYVGKKLTSDHQIYCVGTSHGNAAWDYRSEKTFLHFSPKLTWLFQQNLAGTLLAIRGTLFDLQQR